MGYGKGQGNGELLDSDGKMCCLGFAAKKCNLSEKEIKGHGAPSDVVDFDNLGKMECFLNKEGEDNRITNQLMLVNDSEGYKDQTKREERIIKLFAKLGTKVIFTGKYEG